VLRLPVFVTTTVILCILYFVVTAIQYWATSYAILYFHIPQEMANLAFSVCAISGPVAGVLFGGYVIDELGGYKGKEEREQAIKFIALFCLAGSSMGLGFGFAVV
jgi:sugar phosphate permease